MGAIFGFRKARKSRQSFQISALYDRDFRFSKSAKISSDFSDFSYLSRIPDCCEHLTFSTSKSELFSYILLFSACREVRKTCTIFQCGLSHRPCTIFVFVDCAIFSVQRNQRNVHQFGVGFIWVVRFLKAVFVTSVMLDGRPGDN